MDRCATPVLLALLIAVVPVGCTDPLEPYLEDPALRPEAPPQVAPASAAPCDPLAIDPCPLDEQCTLFDPTSGESAQFNCYPSSEEEPGDPLDPCIAFNGCESGNVCEAGDLVGQFCNFESCCTGLCHLEDPDCVAPDQVCRPLFEDGPDELAHVGLCRIPE